MMHGRQKVECAVQAVVDITHGANPNSERLADGLLLADGIKANHELKQLSSGTIYVRPVAIYDCDNLLRLRVRNRCFDMSISYLLPVNKKRIEDLRATPSGVRS